VRDNSWVLINLLSVGLESGKHVMNGSVSHTQQQAMEAVMNLVEDTQGAMIIGSFNGQQALKGWVCYFCSCRKSKVLNILPSFTYVSVLYLVRIKSSGRHGISLSIERR